MANIEPTQALIGEANRALAYLSDHGVDDYAGVLNVNLEADKITPALDKIEDLLDDTDQVRNQCKGFAGGTGLLKERADLSAEHGDDAIRYLKQEKRILQFGPGRGRAIVLVDNTRFINNFDDYLETPGEQGVILEPADLTDDLSIDDIMSMLKSAIEGLNKHIEESKEHEESLKLREARIAELEQQVEEARLTTWR